MDLVGYLRVSSESQLDGYGLDAQERESPPARPTANGSSPGAGTKAVAVPSTWPTGPDSAAPSSNSGRGRRRVSSWPASTASPAPSRSKRPSSASFGAWVAPCSPPTLGRSMRTTPTTRCAPPSARCSASSRNWTARWSRSGCATADERGRGRAHAVGSTRSATGERARARHAAPDHSEQRTVRRIVELRQAGESYRTIAAALDAEGLRPRRAEQWSPMAVRNVAQREAVAASG